MKNYNIQITVYNKFGELVDRLYGFDSLDHVRNFDWNTMIDDAENYANENNMMVEEMVDFAEEKSDVYIEDLSENSPLNNPANFAN